ncbi:hypothetical protein DFH08DRAFT_817719 [Mycena albidolilacea]|uniref:Uncharacterized protein n=1 Tax=Mycena albidolilacea TaxID=1033008 RepID=A0AAD7EGU2_9AGAR|nr:hypothetical protein DFH08DRAFT_817719 [Mycena albidolilacea]
MHDILVAEPLVSKKWQAITLSPALQRALFFEPDFSMAEYIRNPLLVEMLPPFFAAPLVEEYERDEEDEELEDDEGYEDCQLSWPGQSPALLAMPWARAPELFKRGRELAPHAGYAAPDTNHAWESRALLPDLSLRMGALYDLAVPFVDHADSNFYICWPGHNGHDLKGDLTLAFCSTAGSMPREEERMPDG